MKLVPVVRRIATLVMAPPLAVALAQQPPVLVADHVVTGFPIDLAISPDDSFAVLKTADSLNGAAAAVYIVDLTLPGAPIALQQSHGGRWNSSDFIEVIEDRALATCSQNGQSAPAPELTLYQSNPALLLGWYPNIPAINAALDAMDLAVGWAPFTMLPIAAVAHNQLGVSFWDLKSGTPWGVVPWLGVPSQPACLGLGNAQGLADAIVMTSNRVIVLRNQAYPIGGGVPAGTHGFVGIMELGAPSAGWPKTHEFTACNVVNPPYELLHDLAATPRGLKSVVSGTRLIAVYNNRSGDRIDLIQSASLPTPRFHVNPNPWITSDSVEVTDTRAVVIGNVGAHTGLPPSNVPLAANDPELFRVAVVDISPAVAPLAYAVIDASTVGAVAPARASDLAITPNGSRAVVATRGGALVLDLSAQVTQVPISPAPEWYPQAPDPLYFDTVSGQYPGALFVSDSVACTDEHVVVIGRQRQAPLSGEIWIHSLSDAANSTTVSLGASHIPTDVAITPDGTRAVVRSLHRTFPDTGRITVVDLTTASIVFDAQNFPGVPTPIPLGRAYGRDHVEVTNKFVISAGIMDNALPLSPSGWLQIVKL